MCRYLLFVIAFLYSAAAFAKNDTIRLQQYKEQFWKYQSSDLSVASSYADSLFELSELIGDKQSLSEAYGCKVIVHIQRADYTKATACLKKQKSLNLELDDKLSNATFNNRMGTIHYYQTSLDSALFYWKTALKDYQIYKDDKSAVKMRNNIGVVHFDRGDFEEAYNYYKENQDFYEKNGVKSVALVNCYNNIGLVFKKLNNHEKAKEYYQKSLALVELKGYEKKKQLVFLNLANVYKIDEDYETAIAYYEQSLEISKKNGMPIGVLLSSLGECYFHLNQYVKAETYYDEAYDHLSLTKNKSFMSSYYSRMSVLYAETRRLKKAFEYRLKGLAVDRLLGDKEKLLEHFLALSEIAHELQKFQLSKRYSDTVMFFKDSMYVQMLDNKVYEIESKYEVARKEQEIELLKKESDLASSQTRNIVLLFVLGVLILIGVLVSLYYRNNLLRKNKMIADLESKSRGEKLQYSTLMVSKRNEDLEKLLSKLRTIRQKPTEKDLSTLIKEMEQDKLLERNWDEYLLSFNELHPLFYENLKSRGVKLTPSEKRLSALILQGLTISQIANVLNIGVRSVEVSRSRLRKKLSLSTTDSLEGCLRSLSSKLF